MSLMAREWGRRIAAKVRAEREREQPMNSWRKFRNLTWRLLAVIPAVALLAALSECRELRPQPAINLSEQDFAPALIDSSQVIRLPQDRPHDSVAAKLKAYEGFRSHVYTDTTGHRSIGYGFNLESGITERQADLLLRSKLADDWAALLKAEPWIKGQPSAIQAFLLLLEYQIGLHGEEGFSDMLAALRDGRCADAKAAALSSAWARETPARAKSEIAAMCRD